MLLPELQSLASSLGIASTKMRKADLIGAISAAQSGGRQPESSGNGRPAADGGSSAPRSRTRSSSASRNPSTSTSTQDEGQVPPPAASDGDRADTGESNGNASQVEARRADGDTLPDGSSSDRAHSDRNGSARADSAERNGNQRDNGQRAQRATSQRDNGQRDNGQRDNGQRDNGQRDNQRSEPRQFTQRNDQQRNDQQRSSNDRVNAGNDRANTSNDRVNTSNDRVNTSNDRVNGNANDFRDDDEDGGRRRGRRYRDRRGRSRTGTAPNGVVAGNDPEPMVGDDDVLVPVAGILDAIEDKNAWFVRTNGYFASSDDIYVANSFVRRFNLRRGDAVTGAIRQTAAGVDKREKFSPLVRLDTVNGLDPETLKNRVEFTKLTPLYPQDRLRLETEQHILTTRVIDLVMPIGKGQRALIASPPKAGKTMVLQALANAIATNNPECHLMVVLIDERPEEVTDMQRSVKGEVIASTFDRRPNDHTMVAELSIERAKRLVEMGHDVVVLLDSITRLGRAYNLAAPASGRILSGGVDSTALYPPKRFLGAARNIENGGSLTIIATALVETGSAGDQVIYEEFKGTGNAELKLDRKIADKRTFPAIDVDQSSTRKEEILLSPDELVVTIKLRRVLHALETQQAIDLLLDRLKKTRNNIEFLMQIAKTTPGD